MLQISEEEAKKELGYWVSHGVLKESELQRSQSMGREIQVETVYFASKTLDRNNDREFSGVDDSRLNYIRNQEREDSSFDDSFTQEEKAVDQIKEAIARILQANPNGRTFHQLKQQLQMQKSTFNLSEIKIKEVVDQVAVASTTNDDPPLVLYRLKN